jgi:hypothetical protein
MKTSRPTTEHGQALVIIALAAVALIGFAALAVDGSAVFSDRRQSQNASDTAALAAALAKVRGNPNWQQAGLERAASNGYNESDGVTKVYVHLCNTSLVTDEGITLTCQGLPAGVDPAEYVHVYIKSVVKLYLARVIGWQEVINHTDAVVRATPPKIISWYNGKALVSVMQGCRSPGDNYDPFVVGGSGTTVVNNSGIFVNSTCDPAFEDNGNSNSVTTSEGVCVVGGVSDDVDGVNPPPTENCGTQINPSLYKLPDPSVYCTQPGTITGSGGNYVASPGYFNQTFPNVSPSGVLKLQRGIYCLENGMSLNGNWTITTDWNGDGHNPDTEGAMFYIPDGDVTFNGGSTFNVHAINTTAYNFPAALLNYLIYIPPTNEADLTITGNNGSIFTGTILAPASHLTLDGSGNTFSLDTQIIGYNVTITGSGNIDITYNQANNAVTTTHPSLSAIE